jgi:demethylmenaquinone methyltransferase/2-methoxy-6-polyprenyl-1,4-benzoquinol methylase
VNTRHFCDRISTTYDLLADASERGCRGHGLAALDASPGERILEIGFGTGHALVALSGTVGPTGLVCGIDISTGMLAVTQGTLADAGAVHALLALSDARALAFRDGTFDAVFMSFTLELFELGDMAIVLREIARVLRPGGRLGLVAMSEPPHQTAIVDIYAWLHRHFPHFVDCRPINVRKEVGRGGFGMSHEEMLSMWGLPVACVVASIRP